MTFCKILIFKSIKMCIQRKSSALFFMLAAMFIITVTVNAAEKLIPGNVGMEAKFKELSKRGDIEREFHLSVYRFQVRVAIGIGIEFALGGDVVARCFLHDFF